MIKKIKQNSIIMNEAGLGNEVARALAWPAQTRPALVRGG